MRRCLLSRVRQGHEDGKTETVYIIPGEMGLDGFCPSMEKPMKTPKIPHTDSITELARFWDTHALTDFEDELEEVHEPIFERHTEETVTIHLPTEEFEAVKRMAQAQGVGHTALIREWVLEKLHHA